MQTSTPSFSRVLVMVVFALSCFGLLLFLWLSFGGPIPLKPKGYRVQVGFPEATQLGLEADVRVAGVSVGKLRKKTLDPNSNRTLADARDRPQVRAAEDRHEGDAAPEVAARRDLRRADAGLVGEDGARGRAPAQRQRQADRRARRDLPRARPADARAVPHLAAGPRRGHPRAAARTSTTRSARCPASRTTAPTSSRCSTRRRARSPRLVKNTGVTFGALTENEQQLSNLITSAGQRVRRHRLAAGQPRRDDPDPADVPRRVEGDRRSACGRSRATRSRWSRTCSRSRATSSRRCTTCACSHPTCGASSTTSTR